MYSIYMNIQEEQNIFLVIEEIEVIKEKKVLYTEAQKRATMKWREKNRLQYNEYMRPQRKKFYEENRETVLLKKSNKYFWNKESKRLRDILID